MSDEGYAGHGTPKALLAQLQREDEEQDAADIRLVLRALEQVSSALDYLGRGLTESVDVEWAVSSPVMFVAYSRLKARYGEGE